jgi:uncharacterized zinc-type alcohol dehydrogenase-like protein
MFDAYAAMRAGASLEPFQYSPNELGSMAVEITISHCDICHSDLQLIDNDWGVSAYPLVPGHEIVGIVTGIGNAVRHLRIGQRVGVGWWAASCMACEQCLNSKYFSNAELPAMLISAEHKSRRWSGFFNEGRQCDDRASAQKPTRYRAVVVNDR